MLKIWFLGVLLPLASVGFSQGNTKHPSPPAQVAQVKEAKPEDVASIDAILAALYDVISGPAGQKRDWDRMRSLFASEARMAATVKRRDGTVGKRSFTVEEYIAQNAKPMEDGGFFEKEITKHVDQYGQIAQVFSSYESRRSLSEEKPFARGINSLSLWNDGKRWWVLSIIWQGETPENPLPAKFDRPGSGNEQH